MKPKSILLIILIAAAGYFALALLFERYHPATRFGFVMDRTGAIERARAEAARLGIDTNGFKAGVETSTQGTSIIYLDDRPHPDLFRFLTPVVSEVTLSDPASGRSIVVDLGADGRVGGYRIRGPSESPKPQPSDAQSTEAEKAEAAERLAEEELAAMVGDQRSRFIRKPDSKAPRFAWEMTVEGETRVKIEATATISNGEVSEFNLTPSFSEDYLKSLRRDRTLVGMLEIGLPIIVAVSLLLAFVFYILNIVRNEVRHRSTLIFLAALFVINTIWSINGAVFEDLYSSLVGSPPLKSVLLGIFLTWLVILLLNLLFMLPFFIWFSAGYPYAVMLAKNPLSSVELLLRGQVKTRIVGRSLFSGLAFGWIFPIIPLLLVAAGIVSYTDLRPGSYNNSLTARAPLLSQPTIWTTVDIYLLAPIFVFVLPLVGRYLRRPLLVRLLMIALGVVALHSSSPFRTSMLATTLTAIAVTLLVEGLSHRVDILAAMLALVAGDFATKLVAFAAQPSVSLQRSAWIGWAALVAGLAASALLAWRGRELTEREARAPWRSDAQRANRVERERLKAEFDVARRAQQKLLPAAPPYVPGVEIAAICRPAREVGGDLYDFLKLSDGRLGVVVADVSGKGVPASLYMTLTKGLLASVSETTSDPGQILQEVNRHLYAVCRKKVFVTLLLAIIDPETKKLTYGRAGHNPPVWRRREGMEASLLKAPGLGLGLNSGEIFKRALKVDSRQLDSGDLLILYSDGITEAMNEKREEYGEERLLEVARRLDGLSADRARDEVLSDVGAFLGKTAPQDDQTLVVVRIL